MSRLARFSFMTMLLHAQISLIVTGYAVNSICSDICNFFSFSLDARIASTFHVLRSSFFRFSSPFFFAFSFARFLAFRSAFSRSRSSRISFSDLRSPIENVIIANIRSDLPLFKFRRHRVTESSQNFPTRIRISNCSKFCFSPLIVCLLIFCLALSKLIRPV